MITRTLTSNLLADYNNKKAIVVVGPRQVGKTTLIHKLVEGKKALFLNGDENHLNCALRAHLVSGDFIEFLRAFRFVFHSSISL